MLISYFFLNKVICLSDDEDCQIIAVKTKLDVSKERLEKKLHLLNEITKI